MRIVEGCNSYGICCDAEKGGRQEQQDVSRFATRRGFEPREPM